MRLSNEFPCRLARFTFSVLMALAWCGYPGAFHRTKAYAAPPAGAAAAAPATTRPSPEEIKRIADQMERALAALEAADKQLPRDTFDLQAIVDRVGKDPAKLFEWARDHTSWAPYRGALRGPTGVLMDRLGSSLDRSLLLAELLRLAGHQVRLARAELTEEQARTLLPKVRPIPREPLPRVAETGRKEADALIEKYASDYHLDAAVMRTSMEKALFDADRLAEDVAQRVAEQTPIILQAVGSPDAKAVAVERERESAAQLAALRDHWWVQRLDGNGWTSLDPLLPDAAPGSAPANAVQTIAADPKTGLITLDSKFCHEVRVNVVIEQSTKDGLREQTVLTHTLRPFELFGQRIVLRHVPVNWPSGLDLLAEKAPLEKLKSTTLALDEWLPVLTVGANPVMQSSFTDTGDADATAPVRIAALFDGKALGKSVGGILGSGRIGGDGPGLDRAGPRKSDGRLTAEWIDYEVHVPGVQPQKVRRQLFDLVGPAARKAGAGAGPPLTEPQRLERGLILLGETEILPLVCQLSPQFVQHLCHRSALANKSLLLDLMRGGPDSPTKPLTDTLSRITPMPSQLYSLALARRGFGQTGSDVYLDRPNILSQHAYLGTSAKGESRACRSFDIVTNDVAVRRDAVSGPFQARIAQGVLDTNAEALLMRGWGKVQNTSEIFAAANAAGTEWVTIRGSRDPAWGAVELPGDVRARIERDLAAGYTVVVPRKQPPDLPLGWWRIDPTTGLTLGIGQQGWGATTAEKVLLVSTIVVAVVAGAACYISVLEDRTLADVGGIPAMILCILATEAAVVGALAGGVVGGFLGLAAGIMGLLVWGIQRWGPRNTSG